jgi:hypothetical protein
LKLKLRNKFKERHVMSEAKDFSEETQKVSRPWFKKKRYWIAALLLAFFGAGLADGALDLMLK